MGSYWINRSRKRKKGDSTFDQTNFTLVDWYIIHIQTSHLIIYTINKEPLHKMKNAHFKIQIKAYTT